MTALWDAAVRLYGRPGVRDLCLELQDRHGIDVPVLLCASWLMARGVEVDAGRWAALNERSRVWQRDVVTGLRRVRRTVLDAASEMGVPAADATALKRQIQAVELATERAQLDALAALAAPWEGTGALHADGLARLVPGLPPVRWAPLVDAIRAEAAR